MLLSILEDRQTERERDRERENKNAFLSAGKSQQERVPPARGGVEPSTFRVRTLSSTD